MAGCKVHGDAIALLVESVDKVQVAAARLDRRPENNTVETWPVLESNRWRVREIILM